MIARIEGTLATVETEAALLHLDAGLTYEVLLPAFTVNRLAARAGERVTLHTLEFLESQNQGATFIPRLAGFLTAEDKAFYELLVTAKGIGYRRALRAMTLAAPQIAAAIADRDLATLQSLPEIGKRTAENLTVNLRDKVEHFADAGGPAGQPATPGAPGTAETGGHPARTGAAKSAVSPGAPANDPGTAPASSAAPDAAANPAATAPAPRPSQLAREAVEALVQLGEPRTEAMQWVDRIMAEPDPPATSEAILGEVYQRKAAAR